MERLVGRGDGGEMDEGQLPLGDGVSLHRKARIGDVAVGVVVGAGRDHLPERLPVVDRNDVSLDLGARH